MHGGKNPNTNVVGERARDFSACVTEQSDGVTLTIKLQPRASKNEVMGVRGGELCIKVTAPPVDSAANEALIRLLAENLGCSRSRISLLRGQTSRHKVVKIFGVTAAEISRGLPGS